MALFAVAEKFVSINGEGPKAGETSVFIRFRGCNLSCGYCDTKWANDFNAPACEESVGDLVKYVLSTGVKNVTLTGGEPLLQRDIEKLVVRLAENGIETEIETNGSVSIKSLSELCLRPHFTLDYKLPSSGMERHMLTQNYDYLKKGDAVKFVCSNEDDLIKAKRIIDEFSLTEKCSVYLSPVFGVADTQKMVEFMIKNAMNGVRLQLQLHKFIWDPDMKGV